jgi:hypothetical protein
MSFYSLLIYASLLSINRIYTQSAAAPSHPSQFLGVIIDILVYLFVSVLVGNRIAISSSQFLYNGDAGRGD